MSAEAKNIFVTGGIGFIGVFPIRAILRLLESSGCKPRAFGFKFDSSVMLW